MKNAAHPSLWQPRNCVGYLLQPKRGRRKVTEFPHPGDDLSQINRWMLLLSILWGVTIPTSRRDWSAVLLPWQWGGGGGGTRRNPRSGRSRGFTSTPVTTQPYRRHCRHIWQTLLMWWLENKESSFLSRPQGCLLSDFYSPMFSNILQNCLGWQSLPDQGTLSAGFQVFTRAFFFCIRMSSQVWDTPSHVSKCLASHCRYGSSFNRTSGAPS